MSGTQTNAQKKQDAIAKAKQLMKEAEQGTQQQKDDAAAALHHAQNMPD